MITSNALLGLVGQYGSANVKCALALAGTDDEVMATNAVLDVHQKITKAIDEVYAENEQMRDLCHKSLLVLLSVGDALNWPDDVEAVIAELLKALGR